MQLFDPLFRISVRTKEIGPDVFMEYRLIQIFWFIRFSVILWFYENDAGRTYPLRYSDFMRLQPRNQIPWLDRFGWPVVLGIMGMIYHGIYF